MNGTEKQSSLMGASVRQKSIFVMRCNLPWGIQATTTGAAQKCAVDWISAGNESNLSDKACEKH